MSGPGQTEYRNPRGVMTVGDKTSLPESVHQRMMRANEAAARRANAAKAVAPAKTQSLPRPAAAIDIRGYLGDERTGIRKPTTSFAAGLKAKAAAKKVTPAAVVRTATDMKTSPVKTKAPARMAVNPFTGNTLGFTTGKTTGSTSSKSGTAMRTPMTTNQRMAQNAFNKGGVSGPRKTADGKNASYGFGGSKGGKKK